MSTAPYHPRHIAASTSLILALGLLAACAGKATPAAPTATAAAAATSVASTAAPAATGTTANGTTVPASTQPVVVSGAGDIAAVVDQYRALLGDNNGGDPTTKPSGRREINWDAVPDAQSAPNLFPSDFFNATTTPRARGIIFTTPGTGLQVSAASKNPTNTPPLFGNINPTYVDIFKTFSPEKLFSPLGSNIVDLSFFVPGTQTPALVRGFGAVYTNVEGNHTAYEYFDQNGQSLGRYTVPPQSKGLSFLGVVFPSSVVAHVRVQYGTVALGPNDDATHNVAVMDDFIYGEPQASSGTVVNVPPAPTTPAAAGFALVAKSANRDAADAAFEPALTAGATTAGDPSDLWVIMAENAAGKPRQIFASELVEDVFAPRGGALNFDPAQQGHDPTITFAGQDRAVPWAAWYEDSTTFAGGTQLFASRFDAVKNAWQPAGLDRGSKVPSLNHDTKKPAIDPFIFSGSGDPSKPPTPWIAWLEDSSVSNFAQIFVAKGVKDDAAIGGFHFELVGANNANNEPSVNVDVKRDSAHPSGVFAETDSAVPWITWSEFAAGRAGRIFTARGVADAKTPGGFKWVNVPPCVPDEKACTLNLNPGKEAKDGAMAAGSVTAGNAPVPWIAWAEVGPTGKYQIVVSRLDPSTHNSFLQVGGSLNVDPNHDAQLPRISFVGTVPYVAWQEDDGNGHFSTQLRHLASDPQTGNWVLDSPAGGLRRAAGVNQSELFAAAGNGNLFLAWTEGDPLKEASQVLAGLLKP
jgi:hypothetical protein